MRRFDFNGSGVHHQRELTPQAVGILRQPGRQVLGVHGCNFLKLFGQLAPHGHSPRSQVCQRQGQRLDAVRCLQQNHCPGLASQRKHGTVPLGSFAGKESSEDKTARLVFSDAGAR